MDERAFYRQFGDRLRSARRRREVTQADLATAIDMSRTSITNMEQGNQPVHLDTVYQLADALGIEVVDLLPELEPATEDVDVDQWPDQVQSFIHRFTGEHAS